MNIIKQRAVHTSNFTILHNEILRATKNTDKGKMPLSLEAIGLFVRIMSLPPDWHLHYEGLAAISGCQPNTIKKYIHELMDAGYIEMKKIRTKDGRVDGFSYLIKETINEQLWKMDNQSEIVDIKNEQEISPYVKLSHVEKRHVEKRHVEKRHVEFCDVYKENNNKENTYKENNNKEYNIITSTEEIQNSENKNINNLNFSSLKINKNINENFAGLDFSLDPIKEPENEQKIKKSRKKQKDENYDPSVKNKALQKPSLRTQDMPEFQNVIGDLTDTDNKLSRMLHTAKQIAEVDKAMNKTSMRSVSQNSKTKKYISQNYPQLVNELQEYADMHLGAFNHALTTQSLKANMDKLVKETNGNIEMQKAAIQQSINKQYKGFFINEQIKNSCKPQLYTETVVNKAQAEDAYALATTEDGKPLLF